LERTGREKRKRKEVRVPRSSGTGTKGKKRGKGSEFSRAPRKGGPITPYSDQRGGRRITNNPGKKRRDSNLNLQGGGEGKKRKDLFFCSKPTSLDRGKGGMAIASAGPKKKGEEDVPGKKRKTRTQSLGLTAKVVGAKRGEDRARRSKKRGKKKNGSFFERNRRTYLHVREGKGAHGERKKRQSCTPSVDGGEGKEEGERGVSKKKETLPFNL